MATSKIREMLTLISYLFVFIAGGVAVYFAMFPISYVWGTFFSVEIHSEASFPLGHIARIYSAPGIGDQQLICIVDGTRVYRTPDWEPGNVHEEIVWDESGKIVTFIALGRKFFTYNTETRVGKKE